MSNYKVIVQANAHLLEIAQFEHKMKKSGCADELVAALTTSMKALGQRLQERRQEVEATSIEMYVLDM